MASHEEALPSGWQARAYKLDETAPPSRVDGFSPPQPLWDAFPPQPSAAEPRYYDGCLPMEDSSRQQYAYDDAPRAVPADLNTRFPTYAPWNQTPDLGSMPQFSSFPSSMSPYSSISPYAPSVHAFSQPQEPCSGYPLDRQYSSISSSASSSSLASSLGGHDRHSPLESSTSHSSSSSLYLSSTLALTPAAALVPIPPCGLETVYALNGDVKSILAPRSPATSEPTPAAEAVPTVKTEEDLNDYFDHIFRKPAAPGFAESRARQSSSFGSVQAPTPRSLDISHVGTIKTELGPLSAPPLLSPSPIHGCPVRPALLTRQHSLHGFGTEEARTRSDSTTSYDSSASLGLGSHLGALAIAGEVTLPESPAQIPMQRTVDPLAISAGPVSPSSIGFPLPSAGMVAPPMMSSVSLSAIQSPANNLYRSNGAPTTPRLRALQQSEGGTSLGWQDAPPSEGRPRSSSSPNGGSARLRHSRNGSVVLAAGGRQLQTLAALKGALDGGDAGGTGPQRRRSIRASAADPSARRTPPVSPVATPGVLDPTGIVTSPGGTVKARKTERRSGLLDTIMARGSPLMSATGLPDATDPHVDGPALAAARSMRRRSDEVQGPLLDEDGAEIETDADGRLICGMMTPDMTEPCRRAFKRKEHRKRHQRQHTNEKPYPCPKCGMRFTRTDNCNQHIRTHENKDGRNSKMLRERQEREARGLDAAMASQRAAAHAAQQQQQQQQVCGPGQPQLVGSVEHPDAYGILPVPVPMPIAPADPLSVDGYYSLAGMQYPAAMYHHHAHDIGVASGQDIWL